MKINLKFGEEARHAKSIFAISIISYLNEIEVINPKFVLRITLRFSR